MRSISESGPLADGTTLFISSFRSTFEDKGSIGLKFEFVKPPNSGDTIYFCLPYRNLLKTTFVGLINMSC